MLICLKDFENGLFVSSPSHTSEFVLALLVSILFEAFQIIDCALLIFIKYLKSRFLPSNFFSITKIKTSMMFFI